MLREVIITEIYKKAFYIMLFLIGLVIFAIFGVSRGDIHSNSLENNVGIEYIADNNTGLPINDESNSNSEVIIAFSSGILYLTL